MDLNVLESVQNPRVKLAVKLSRSGRERRRTGLFFAEGERLCADCCDALGSLETLFVTREGYEKYGSTVDSLVPRSRESFLITRQIADKISDTVSDQGVFALCRCFETRDLGGLPESGSFVCLERVQNPDNLGAVARTAEAMGLDGVIVCGGCDVFSPKAQRAAMGALCRIPVYEADSACDFLMGARQKGYKLRAACLGDGSVDIRRIDLSAPVIVVIGNEGAGVSEEVQRICGRFIIPMKGKTQSLNAAAAAAITIWEMQR